MFMAMNAPQMVSNNSKLKVGKLLNPAPVKRAGWLLVVWEPVFDEETLAGEAGMFVDELELLDVPTIVGELAIASWVNWVVPLGSWGQKDSHWSISGREVLSAANVEVRQSWLWTGFYSSESITTYLGVPNRQSLSLPVLVRLLLRLPSALAQLLLSPR